MEKLDSLSKILLATGTINYLATNLASVNQDMKHLLSHRPESERVHGEGIKAKDELLDEVVKDLGSVMEKLGNLTNSHDCLCGIDVYVTTPAFHVVVLGKDDVEYDGHDDND